MTVQINRHPAQSGGIAVHEGIEYVLVPAVGVHGYPVRGVFEVRQGEHVLGTVGEEGWSCVRSVATGMEERMRVMREIAAAWSGPQAVLDWLIEYCPEIAPQLRETRAHVVRVTEGGKAFVVAFDDTSADKFAGLWSPASPVVLTAPTPEDDEPEASLVAASRAQQWRNGVRSYLHIRKVFGGPGSLNIRFTPGCGVLDD